MKLNSAIYISMSRSLLQLERNLEQLLREHGLTKTQFAVMEALYHKGTLSQFELHKIILTTAGNLPVVVRNLKKEKLILEKVDKKDRRRKHLSLSKKGIEVMEEILPKHMARIDEAYAVWDSNEKRQLYKLLRKFGKENHGS